METVSLEDELQPELNDPGIIGCRDLSKETASNVRRGIGEFRVIEDVEELCSEFHIKFLAENRSHLRNRQVQVGTPGSSECISRKRAVSSQRRISYSRCARWISGTGNCSRVEPEIPRAR